MKVAALAVILFSQVALASAARINWCIPYGNTATQNTYRCQILFDGNGGASQLELVEFTVNFTATKAQRNSAAATAIIAKGASMSPAFTLLAADIGPD